MTLMGSHRWAWVLACALLAAPCAAEPVAKASLAARTFRVEKDTKQIAGGTSEKYLLSDERGGRWLFKPMPAWQAALEEACFRLATALGLSTPEVFGVVVQGGINGSLARMVPNRGNLRHRRPSVLTERQVRDLLELQVFDWLIGNFDNHERNFLVDERDDVITIDHGLAFDDGDFFEFDLARGPRWRLQSYFRDLWEAYAKREANVQPQNTFAFVDRVTALPDAVLERVFRPFAEMKQRALGWVMADRYGDRVYRTADEFLFALARRKAAVREEIAGMDAALAAARGERFVAPPAVKVDGAAVPEVDPAPLAITVQDDDHHFRWYRRLGHTVKLNLVTVKEAGARGVMRAIEQGVKTVVNEVHHAVYPVIHGGLTGGQVTSFAFDADVGPDLEARIGRTSREVLELFRHRALYVAVHGSAGEAGRARRVLALIGDALRR